MIAIKEKDYQEIVAYAKAGLPNEVCGLLAGAINGEEKRVEKVYYLSNTDQSSEHFTMDPREQLETLKDIRTNNLILLGNFHSHPETPARPSEEDKRLAFDSKVNYLILSLMDFAQPVLKVFYIANGVSREEQLEII